MESVDLNVEETTTKYIAYLTDSKHYRSGKYGSTDKISKARVWDTPGRVSQSVGSENVRTGKVLIVPVTMTIDKTELVAAIMKGEGELPKSWK